MSPLTTDNRNMAEIETELRARIEAQRAAIEYVREENIRDTFETEIQSFTPANADTLRRS